MVLCHSSGRQAYISWMQVQFRFLSVPWHFWKLSLLFRGSCIHVSPALQMRAQHAKNTSAMHCFTLPFSLSICRHCNPCLDALRPIQHCEADHSC